MWIGAFTGKEFTKASDVDIDHKIPVKYAHDHSGADWSPLLKRLFANWLHTMKKLLLLLLLLPALVFGQGDFEETKALAEQGDIDALYKLGNIYRMGDGVPRDAVEAVKWYRLAAENGKAWAGYNLGVMYSFGDGVPENDAEAVKWYRLAAEQGYALAQYNLGGMYSRGDGVPVNNIRAYVWWSVSSANGFVESMKEMDDSATTPEDSAKKNRDNAADKLTPEQLATGQDLATKCFESDFKDCPF